MAIREGKWRCTFCGAVNRGRDLDCGGCGARRGADVEFFLEDDAPVVTEAGQLAEATAGPDWLCETCGGSNRFRQPACQTCGAPPGDSEHREIVEGAVGAFRDPGDVWGVAAADSPHAAHAAGDYRYDDGTRAGAGGWVAPRWTPSLSVITLLAGLVLLLVFLAANRSDGPRARVVQQYDPYTATRDVELVVEQVGWARSVEVEDFRLVTDEGWEGEVPDGASVLSRQQAIHHHDRVKVSSHTVPETYTERVKSGTRVETEYYTDREYGGTERYRCGTRNRGNGYFEDVYCTRPVYKTVRKSRNKMVDDYQTVTRTRDRVVEDFKDVPVYRTKVTYKVKRWVAVDRAVAEGTDLAPRWPEVSVNATRREGQRAEKYTVHLRDARGRAYEHEVSAADFPLFAVGAKCAGKVNGLDQLVALTPPSPAGSR